MIDVTWETLPLIVLTVIVALLGVGRFTRVVVYDEFPPTKWWRESWVTWLNGTPLAGWASLFTCWWCFSFWAALLCIGWWIGGLFAVWAAWSWWIFWGGLAVSYAATMIIVRDEPIVPESKP